VFLFQALVLAALVGVAALVRANLRAYRRPPPAGPPQPAPAVTVIVPARNEEANIAACLAGLLAQDYPRLKVRVLDDGSTDRTAALARAARGPAGQAAEVVSGGGPPPGWAGKARACWEAAQWEAPASAVGGAEPPSEWLLFLDADTRAEPGFVTTAVAAAVAADADLLSTFPRQRVGTLGEALTVPFIFWVLFTLLPIRRVWEDPNPAFAAACGQVLLVRRAAYQATGGHFAIRGSLHDGLHLARLFKRAGRRVLLADLSDRIACRMYHGWAECWAGFTRNAYQGIGSPGVLLFLTLWHGLLGLGPFVSLAWGAAGGGPAWTWLALAQAAVVLGIQAALRGRFHLPWAAVLLHPLGIAALLAIQWGSALRARAGGQARWKGRSVPADCRP
jgi:hypothetical protein